jgi:hypothetical protein
MAPPGTPYLGVHEQARAQNLQGRRLHRRRQQLDANLLMACRRTWVCDLGAGTSTMTRDTFPA